MARTQPDSFYQSAQPPSTWDRRGRGGGQRFLNVTLLLASIALSVSATPAQTQPKAKVVQHPSQTAQQQEQKVPATASLASPPDHAIPLPQVADRAEELDRLLQNISKQLTPMQDLIEADRASKAQAEVIRQRVLEADGLLASMPNGLELRDEDVYWRSLSQQYAAQRKLQTARAANLQSQILWLDDQQVQWQATWDHIQDIQGIEAVVDRARQELDRIRATRAQTQEQLNLVLTIQNQVSQQDQQISDLTIRLHNSQERLRGSLLLKDGYPLWETRELRKLDQPMSTLIRRSVTRDFKTAGEFLRTKKRLVWGILALYVLATVFQIPPRRREADVSSLRDREGVMNTVRSKRARLRLDPEQYDTLRNEVLRRDSWKCQSCGTMSNLEVHHGEFRSQAGDDSEENLITLCNTCHASLHDARSFSVRY